MNLAIAIPRKELGTRGAARNREVARCLSLGADRILMMDSDQTMPLDAIDDMIDYWVPDYDIVVVDAPDKTNTIKTNVTYNPDGTMAWTGFGCAYFKREVFEKIPAPWFDSSYSYTFETKAGKYVFTRQDKYKDDNFGEDITFYFKCLDAGIKIKVLEGLKCVHKEINETY